MGPSLVSAAWQAERAAHRAVVRWRALYSRSRPRIAHLHPAAGNRLHWRLMDLETEAIEAHQAAERQLRAATAAALSVEPVVERPYEARWSYVAFLNGPEGDGADLALAVAHKEGARVVLDLARTGLSEWSALELLRYYRHAKVYGETEAEPGFALAQAAIGALRRADR